MTATAERTLAFGLSLDPAELLPADRYRFGPALSADARLMALARALASSPAWVAMRHGIMVVRTEPPRGIAWIGRFTSDEEARIEALPAQLAHELARFRWLDHADVEQACSQLGERLVTRFGRDEVRGFRYVAIPRGGLFVLGTMSYVLDLPRERLGGAPARDGTPTVIVDDVALTGLRFGEFLRRQAGEPAIFAHLFSHPDLRAAIRTREPSVVDVVAAHDLTDFAPELLGEGYEAWRRRWAERSGSCYWVGRHEHLCFPWAEPDLTFWNPVSGREEASWRLAPPSAALKNRAGGRTGGERLQVQPPSSGPVRVAERTLWGELDGAVVVASLDTRDAVALDEVAGEIWRVLAGAGGVDEATRAVLARFEADPDQVRADVEKLVHELVARGLLVEAGTRRYAGTR